MKTLVTREGLRLYDHLSPEEALIEAWIRPGSNPVAHAAAQTEVLHMTRRVMPLVHRALLRLILGGAEVKESKNSPTKGSTMQEMSEPTPTTDEVRDTYGWGADGCGCCAIAPEKHTPKFDRWLASVKAEAWQEGYDEPRECCGLCPKSWCPWDDGQDGPTNPYRKKQ